MHINLRKKNARSIRILFDSRLSLCAPSMTTTTTTKTIGVACDADVKVVFHIFPLPSSARDGRFSALSFFICFTFAARSRIYYT